MKWWHTFYDQTFAERMLAAAQPQELDFILDQLQLEPGQRVFDQCCGPGRLSRPLAERGLEVVGVDWVQSYVDAANASCAGLPCRFEQGDAGSFVAAPACHGALNAYSSFGYSSDDEENRQLLERVRESLLPGGRFLLDTINAARVLRDFRPRLERVYPDGFRLVRECRLDWRRGMLEQDWTYHECDGTTRRTRGDTRLYLPHHLVNLLERSGFAVERLFGGYDGADFEMDSPRLIVLARKDDGGAVR